MKRAVLISGQFWTESKRSRIRDFLRRYGDAVRFYIRLLWQDKICKYQDFGDTRLSARLKTAALRQAQSVVTATRKASAVTGKPASCPNFRGNCATLDAKNVKIRVEPINRGTFDVFVDLRVLHNNWVVLPCKATKRLRHWLQKPGAKLTQGLIVSEDRLIFWVDVPEPICTGTDEIGVDIGVNKLITTSEGQKIGTEFRNLGAKVRRKQPGGQAKLRARRERDQFFRRSVNLLPWQRLKTIVVEDLTGLKVGKKRGRGKNFRKALTPWRYRQVLSAVELKAQENGVLLIAIDPHGTSRTCPVCGTENRMNRRDEDFLCLSCGHAGDADCVAAGNILSRARTVPVWSRHGPANSL